MKTLLVITGASRGLGRSFAKQFVHLGKSRSNSKINENPQHHFIRALLLGRTIQDLHDTESVMRQEIKLHYSSSSESTTNQSSTVNLKVTSHSIDLSDLNALEENLNKIFESELYVTNNQKEHFDCAILVNNAGSIDHIGPLTAVSTLKQMRNDIDFNITSSLWLSIQFAKLFINIDESQSCTTTTTTIINISSLCAIEPFPTMGIYCAGKASRDMFHQVLAQETASKSQSNIKNNSNSIKVLNYAPGACDTDMQQMLRCSNDIDPELGQNFQDMKSNDTIVKPDDSARKLVALIEKGDFQSGAHVDYWDLP